MNITYSPEGITSLVFQTHERVTNKVLSTFLDPHKQSNTKLHLIGTPFQVSVWNALRTIPYGSRVTYSDIAKLINKPTAVRAVARAIAKNPIALLIPCHRVVPMSGGIGKYRWGSDIKKRLLDYESKPY